MGRKDDCNNLEAGTRKCRVCEGWKSLEEFVGHARHYLGRDYICRDCNRAKAAKWAAEYPEQKKAADAKWHAEHREQAIARSRRWIAEHPERRKATVVKWNAEHREQRKATHAKWRAEHREQEKIRRAKWNAEHREQRRTESARRRALKRSLPADPAPVMEEHFKRLYKDGRGKCYYCRRTFNWVKKHDPHPAGRSEVHEEHVIPVSRGGGYTRDNIVLACWRCNLRKGKETPLEAGLALL